MTESEYFLVFLPKPQRIRAKGYKLVPEGSTREDELVANSVITPLFPEPSITEVLRTIGDIANLATILPTPRARRLPEGEITTVEDRQTNPELPFVAVDLRDTQHPQLIIYRRGTTPLAGQTITVPMTSQCYAIGERALINGPDQPFEFSLSCVRRRGGIGVDITTPVPTGHAMG